MPAMDFQGSSSPFSSFGRSLFSLRRSDHTTQVMDAPGSPATSSPGSAGGDSSDLDAFQRLVTDAFHGLLLTSSGGGGDNELLSAAWVRKLLDCFLLCHDHFSDAVLSSPAAAATLRRPPLDRAVAEFLDRSVKALDVCNAVRDGVEHVRQWRKHLEIVLSALSGSSSALGRQRQQRPGAVSLGEGQLRRARRALADLTIAMLDEKDAAAGSAAAVAAAAHRNRSFGRSTTGGAGGSSSSSSGKDHQLRSPFRSLSWSVSRSWSAARQLQAIASNLTPPRSADILATNGLAVPVYTMSCVLLFVTWALVAAIPCQDRGLQVHFSVPKTYPWASPLMALHDRIAEEAKRKDRRSSCGLLWEIHRVERCGRRLTELVEGAAAQVPPVVLVGDDKEAEMRREVEELERVCVALREGLDPLERGVREMFHRIVRSRVDGFDGCCGAAAN